MRNKEKKFKNAIRNIQVVKPDVAADGKVLWGTGKFKSKEKKEVKKVD